MRLVYILMAPVLLVTGLSAAATAAAECTNAGGVTICAQGSVRGPDTGSSGPYVPYPCEYDWYCDYDDWDADIVVNPGPPVIPDYGLPGRPGNRPGIGPR